MSKRVLVVFHSQEKGNTRKMAELVAEGCRKVPGVEVELVPVFNQRADMGKAERADGYALGSPDYFTYMAGEMKTVFDRALSHVKKVKGKPFVSFVSHGGGGGAIESLDRLGKAIGLKPVCEGVKSQGPPSKEGAEACLELGRKLAAAT